VRKFRYLWQGCMSSGYRLSIWCGAEEIQGNLKNKTDKSFEVRLLRFL